MNTALSWIKAYVPDLNCTDQEYFDKMTLSGTKVEGYERLDKNLKDIYIGQILSIEKHPDAEKLVICQVDLKDKQLQIVTGAHNIQVGDKVPVVIDGGKVAGGHDGGPLPEDGIEIRNGKLRGVDSYGMMCSIEELGQSREKYPEAPEDGIYIFPADAEVGADAIEALGLRDTNFEYEITSNRVDCYSVLGIAREVAATFDLPFHAPKVEIKGAGGNVNDYISVEVVDKDLCPRYTARVCKNIKIGPSPKWMQRRLAASGIRPINNLVDITNYVMEEYGQPMHAFDLDTIAGKKIIVKRAKDGDVFMTLDGQERKLDHDILMINDAEKEIGIAGIMGGENSKITDDVHTVLFEAATFKGVNIRKSAKRLGLRTDASGKFEKGLDPNNALDAINRACQLIEELGCGEVVDGVVDVCEPIKPLNRILFQPDKINAFLGTDISRDQMLTIFKKLELVYDDKTGEIVIPSFRQDLVSFADIAEEVARFYGYDKIPVSLPSGEGTSGKMTKKLYAEADVRNTAEALGYSQGMTYSFESPKVFDKLLIAADDDMRKVITIANPLGEDFSVMRTTSLNGMLTSLATNFNRRNKDVRLYELGNIYIPHELPLQQLPDERMQLTLGFYGEGDFFTLKGDVETILENLGIKQRLTYSAENKRNFLHPGRQAEILLEGRRLGYLGQVHPLVASNYDIEGKNSDVYIAVLDMPEVLPFVNADYKYEGIAKYPGVSRDISMVVPKTVTAGQIEDMIIQRGGKILESCKLFDIYEGNQITIGFKSMAYTVTFRAKDRTLEESDITGAMKKILNGLASLGIVLRQ